MKIHRLGILIFLISLGFFLFANHQMPITDPVESNYALTAKEMVQSGNWLSPQIYHQFWFDKPIMIYWLIAVSYKIFGIGEFAARFPSALFSALTVGMMYQVVRNVAGRRIVALWGSFILGTSLEFWVIAHAVITDAVLIWATLGTMPLAYVGLTKPSKWAMVGAYAFAGIAVLTKGPVGIVLPGALLLVFALAMQSWTYVKRLFLWQGIVAFLVVATPWYLLMYGIHGNDFISGFLGLHNYVRATVSEHPEANHWWYYLVLLPLSFLPWTGPVFYEMWAGWKKAVNRTQYNYLMIWGWGTILFYSIMATKYPTYTFIAMLPFSMLGAVGIVRLCNAHVSRKRWTILTGPAIVLWLLWAGASFFSPWGFWYLLYVIVVIGIVMLISFQRRGKAYLLPVTITVVTMLSSAVVIHEGLVPLMERRSTSSIAMQFKNFDGDVYIYGGYDTSLVYYTGKTIERIDVSVEDRQVGAWSGKYTMPRIQEERVLKKIVDHKAVMILVPANVTESFEKSPVRPLMRLVGEHNKDRIFSTK